MRKTLELVGPLGMIAAIVCAELGARALAEWPASSALWYLNLEVFRSFQYSFDSFSFARLIMADQRSQAAWIAVPLGTLICIGLAANLRLALALAANLSLIFSALLLYGAYLASNPVVQLQLNFSGLLSPACLAALVIMLMSFISSAVWHRSYWREFLP